MNRSRTPGAVTLGALVVLVVTVAVSTLAGSPDPWDAAILGVAGIAGIAGIVDSIAMLRARRTGHGELTAALHQLRMSSGRDSTTGLANRTGLISWLDATSRSIEGTDDRVAVVALGIDRLGTVNRVLGHARGDLVLVEMSARLTAASGAESCVARVGGDVIALAMVAGPTVDLAGRVEELLRLVARPARLDGTEVAVAASAGLATSGDAGDPEAILRCALLALDEARRTGGRAFVRYRDEMGAEAAARLRLVSELRSARASGEFEIFYQPVVELPSATIVGAEALLRWNHPTRGVVEAATWIGVAEELGLLGSLGQQTLSEVCRHFAAVNAGRAGRHPLRVAVNLSGSELVTPGLVDHVAATLQATALDPGLLTLEVDETAIADATIAGVVAGLHDLGVRISIDDFGTGYSSLDRLHRLRVDEVKIDRTFVAGLGRPDGRDVFVEAVIRMCHRLGIGVVAEGVSTEGEHEVLRALGCDAAQGHLFGRPLPFTRFLATVARIEGQEVGHAETV